MKIGIVTFWQTKDNYGQMLQAYALQRVLKQMGHSPFIIRYTHSQVTKYIPFCQRLKNSIRHLIKFQLRAALTPPGLVHNYMFPVTENDKKRDFQKFKEEMLAFSKKKYRNFHQLTVNPPKVDALIAGSDQIWVKQPNVAENGVFYLNFGPKKIKRVSYAASFARSEYPDELLAKLHDNLHRLDAVSVREKTGAEICKKAGINAQVVLDPTFLLTGLQYKELFHLSEKTKNMLFMYSININNKNDIYWNDIKSFATDNNLDVVVTPSSGYVAASELFESPAIYSYATISGWLQNICSAKYVVTPSFHGVVFCVLFHKPFLYVPLQRNNSSGNYRVLDLLNDLHIDGHVFHDGDDIVKLLDENVDWAEVDIRLDEMRKQSLNFLNNSLKDDF